MSWTTAGGSVSRGQTPSTHIIKTPIERLAHTVVNEAFCPMVGRELGVDVVDASAQRVAGREFLLVRRYDRREAGDGIVRLHQEDFCQALGVPTARKYQSEGGPSLADCFALVRRAIAVPAREVIKLLDDVGLNFLVGNHDGKNLSLLYLPESGQAVLAPAYDVLSTFAYRKAHNLTRKMAMSIGGEYRPEYVHGRHLDRLFDEAGLGAAAARRRLRGMAWDAPGAARQRPRAAYADRLGCADPRADRRARAVAGHHHRPERVIPHRAQSAHAGSGGDAYCPGSMSVDTPTSGRSRRAPRCCGG